MEFLHNALVYIHLVGFAILLGGWLTAYLSGHLKINAAMLWGSAIQVVSGVVLSAPLPDRDVQPDGLKLVVKAVIAIAIAVMVWLPHLKKRQSSSKGHFIGIGALTLINAAVAVFW